MSVAEILIKTVNFASTKHKHQRRKDEAQTPYINHPLGVAYILTSEAKIDNIHVLQAAILHDTVEDTDTTFEEIETEFGVEVCNIVREVTDDKSLTKETRKKLQVEHAPNSTYEAKLVKLADKLYNLRDLENSPPVDWDENRINQYFNWSKQVVDGLRGTNEAMEKSLDDIFKRHISCA
ncbi:guanosine-3',5'-bis(diphosphate) 3'-pyrophosphohydrolase MESH1 [Agrilus planipennis]|uniref:Guanosine-3',5'-bis(diphosphate) 3'-pyrophosphohydrolase MESH1 n=1 Tax=Agrilus planipennis TaxID=224129 RepID=A0A1W4WBH5_AGRPL|nr:guanosine-3',5'-bis(diphosphate) 3'-pyrophosphohydrolase MESH1 [Agrilus planipennis]